MVGDGYCALNLFLKFIESVQDIWNECVVVFLVEYKYSCQNSKVQVTTCKVFYKWLKVFFDDST